MKIPRRKLLVHGLALGAGLAITLGMSATALAEFQPQKPIQFVVMAGKGGGADKAVRLMQSIIAKNKMAPVPVTPINKPGGSGAEALVYMNGKKGDNHTIMFTLNSFYTTPLRQPALGVDITTFTPVARMAEDTFLLWVNSDRKDINSVDDFVKAAKAKGSGWIMAGTGKSSEDLPVPAMIQPLPFAFAALTKSPTLLMSLRSELTQSRKVSSAIRATGVKVVMSTPSAGWRNGVV